jgi:hypothetical protein
LLKIKYSQPHKSLKSSFTLRAGIRGRKARIVHAHRDAPIKGEGFYMKLLYGKLCLYLRLCLIEDLPCLGEVIKIH